MVDHVRDHTVAPLSRQQGPDLRQRPRQIDMGQAQRDDRRIPVPLMRILTRTRPGEGAGVIGSQDSPGRLAQIRDHLVSFRRSIRIEIVHWPLPTV